MAWRRFRVRVRAFIISFASPWRDFPSSGILISAFICCMIPADFSRWPAARETAAREGGWGLGSE